MRGRVTIARYSDNKSDGGIRIELTDNQSRVRFATALLTFEQFSKAVTGMGEIEVELEVRRLDLVGKTAENKTEIIKMTYPYGDEKKKVALRKAVAKFEVDGWVARTGDTENHNNAKADGIHVVFFRHV